MAHPDFDALLDPLLSFAQEQLAKRGGFLPFGASVTRDGEVALAAGYAGQPQTSPQEVIDLLAQGFRKDAAGGRIRATAICVDARVVPPGSKEKTDAVCVQLEHAEGQCIEVYLPYRQGQQGPEYGDLFVGAGDARVFQSSD